MESNLEYILYSRVYTRSSLECVLYRRVNNGSSLENILYKKVSGDQQVHQNYILVFKVEQF